MTHALHAPPNFRTEHVHCLSAPKVFLPFCSYWRRTERKQITLNFWYKSVVTSWMNNEQITFGVRRRGRIRDREWKKKCRQSFSEITSNSLFSVFYLLSRFGVFFSLSSSMWFLFRSTCCARRHIVRRSCTVYFITFARRPHTARRTNSKREQRENEKEICRRKMAQVKTGKNSSRTRDRVASCNILPHT